MKLFFIQQFIKIIINFEFPFIFTGSLDNSAKIFDMITGNCIRQQKTNNPVRQLGLSQNNFNLISTGKKAEIINLKECENKECIKFVGDSFQATSISPNGQYVASVTIDNQLQILESRFQSTIFKVKLPANLIVSELEISADSEQVIIASSNEILIYELDMNLNVPFLFKRFQVPTIITAFKDLCVEKQKFIMIGGVNGQVYQQTQSGIQFDKFDMHKNSITSITANKNQMATSSKDGSVLLWEWKMENKILTKKIKYEIKKNKYQTLSTSLSRDNNFLVIGNSDGTYEIWDTNKKNILRTIKAHEQGILSILISTQQFNK